MMRIGFHSLLAGLLVFIGGRWAAHAETKDSTLDFKEVYDLIKDHAAGVSESELNRAAVQGLLDALGPRVSLVTNSAAKSPVEGPLVNKTTLFEDGIVYLRIPSVENGLADELTRVYRQVNATNKVKGIVLDLRYSRGTDYAAAATAADLFVSKTQPLLNWGNGAVSSHEKTNSIQVPVAILVNKQTTGAAEALAAVLRSVGAGLILGNETAGRALVTQNFPLKSGEELRIATAPVTLGDGSKISTGGLKPDIDVTVNAEDERAYYADAFYVVKKTNAIGDLAGSTTNSAAGTNGTRRSRFNEAELVREHREGMDRDREPGTPRTRPTEVEAPLVSDPALARALDLLKGLAVVRQG
jgi:C-terminal processing protease CtpA/Prc